MRRMDKMCHRDPVLTILTKLNHAPVFAPEGRDHLEVTYSPWLSSGVVLK